MINFLSYNLLVLFVFCSYLLWIKRMIYKVDIYSLVLHALIMTGCLWRYLWAVATACGGVACSQAARVLHSQAARSRDEGCPQRAIYAVRTRCLSFGERCQAVAFGRQESLSLHRRVAWVCCRSSASYFLWFEQLADYFNPSESVSSLLLVTLQS